MALLQSGNAPLIEQARLGQVIGADYIVTGKLRQTAATRSDYTIGVTGEVVTSTTSGSAEADFQVIEIATRQIKWAGTARISGGGAVDQVGARIADEITQTIYPMRLISSEDPASLVVNQGGSSLRVGQRFRAMVLGEMIPTPTRTNRSAKWSGKQGWSRSGAWTRSFRTPRSSLGTCLRSQVTTCRSCCARRWPRLRPRPRGRNAPTRRRMRRITKLPFDP